MKYSKKNRLPFSELSFLQIRKKCLTWGRLYTKCKFSDAPWTTYFHYFHEHLWWEVHQVCLDHCCSMMTEGQIHVAKILDRQINAFRNQRKGESIGDAGCRKMSQRLWIRGKYKRENTEEGRKILDAKRIKEGKDYLRDKYTAGRKKAIDEMPKGAKIGEKEF